MSVIVEPLAYDLGDLHPVISAQTMQFHYQRHYAGYVQKTNELVTGTAFEGKDLSAVVRESYDKPALTAVFNNAGQAYNHAFFWKSLQPVASQSDIPPALAEKIKADFGSVDAVKAALKTAGVGQFGSGWVWLVLQEGRLDVVATANAISPLVMPGVKPLLCLDVWEHAYYLDYQNRRADFLQAVLDNIVNWHFAAANLQQD